MLVDRINKETTDISRVIVDLDEFLDPSEVVTEIVSANISLGTSGWTVVPWPPPSAPPPYDPTPLLFHSYVMDAANRTLIMFVRYGTPGNVYTAQFVLAGTSARQTTIEIGVQVLGIPPKIPPPYPVPASQIGLTLPITGGTMQGPLYLFESPLYPTEAATKQYVDSVAGVTGGPFLSLSGGQMAGPLLLGEDPVHPTEAATKHYVDMVIGVGGFLPLSGGVMTGNLALAGPPHNPLDAATKAYVDSTSGVVGGPFLSLSGGTMTGPLTLAADPVNNLDSATKQYVDSHVPFGGPFLSLAGGTMTGAIVLSGDPTANRNPVTLQYFNGHIPAASTLTPTMAGTAAVGTNTGWSRGDHVHPTDTSRYAASNPSNYQTAAQVTSSLGAYLPLAGGQMTGYMTSRSGGASHPTLENLPTLDFNGTCITFQRRITNATANEVGANPKVVVQLDNECSNYTVQPWGGYDGPTAFYVNATNGPTSAGSVVALWTQITSQGPNNYTAQDTAHLVRVIRTGQNSCWGIAIQHQDNTGMPAQAFSTMGIENAMQINGPDDPRSYYNCTYSLRQGMSFIPSVNPTGTWAASQTWPAGTVINATPTGGVNTCYVSQNQGTTGTTQPVWPPSGNVLDGSITWATGVPTACELGLAILIGGGRPQLPNTVINTGIGFNSPINNACIDTTLAVMKQSTAAAIRLAEGQIIDFTGGGALANQNRRTLGYSDAVSAMAMIMNGGLVASTWSDDGTFIVGHLTRLAGNSNLSGVTQADSNSLSIGKNLTGGNNFNFITGQNGLTISNTNASGLINTTPYVSFATTGMSLSGTKVVGPQIAGWGTSTGGARGAVIAGTATLAQVAAALAQLLTDLKTHGLLGT